MSREKRIALCMLIQKETESEVFPKCDYLETSGDYKVCTVSKDCPYRIYHPVDIDNAI